MAAIFLLEWKKALSSRKNLFIIVLYTGFLFTFAITNVRTFSDMRERELQRLRAAAARTEQTAKMNWFHTSYNPNRVQYSHLDERVLEIRTLISNKFYDSLLIIADNCFLMVEAMEISDRTAEIYFFNNMRLTEHERYLFTYDLYGVAINPYGNEIARGRPPVPYNYVERIAYHQAHREFTQYFVDNNIPHLYESEMRGLNFAYQVMRQILPMVMLFIVLVSISDVFTSDNQWGSYKFLLTNPVSRAKVFFIKLVSACSIAFVMVFGPVAVLVVILSVINGFGPVNYPILTQWDAFTSLTALPNNLAADREIGNFVGRWTSLFSLELDFINNGLAYIREHPSLGLTSYSSYRPVVYYLFPPHPDLRYTPMLRVIFMSLPLYMLLILAASALSAMLSAFFQRGIPVVIISVTASLGVVFFPAPESDAGMLTRLSPYFYTNPVNILNGLGSTTALTGVFVLAGWSVLFIGAGLLLFARRDIRC
jgi:ABC-type transport system involved in multi-copper enzyme maturation permease subunit